MNVLVFTYVLSILLLMSCSIYLLNRYGQLVVRTKSRITTNLKPLKPISKLHYGILLAVLTLGSGLYMYTYLQLFTFTSTDYVLRNVKLFIVGLLLLRAWLVVLTLPYMSPDMDDNVYYILIVMGGISMLLLTYQVASTVFMYLAND